MTKRLILFMVGMCLGFGFACPVKAQQEPHSLGTLKNIIRWSTASEVDNFGFDVYRAEQEEGPFARITQQPVAGAGTSDEPARYEYVDETLKSRDAVLLLCGKHCDERGAGKIYPDLQSVD